MHVNVGPGSYLELTVPWVVQADGYTTKVIGQLLHLEATTSLQYRSLVVSETLEFTVRSRYPLRWNGHQEWLLHLTGCKASIWFIYAHKEFFQGSLILKTVFLNSGKTRFNRIRTIQIYMLVSEFV